MVNFQEYKGWLIRVEAFGVSYYKIYAIEPKGHTTWECGELFMSQEAAINKATLHIDAKEAKGSVN